MIRLLCVCLGNICRSPSAEALLRQKLSEYGLSASVDVDSAGTAAFHIGKAPDRRATAVGAGRGVDLSLLRARQVELADFYRFDFILAMDHHNLSDLQQLEPEDSRAALALFLDFAPSLSEQEVPDPYYGEMDGFERMFDLLEEAAEGVISHLQQSKMLSSV